MLSDSSSSSGSCCYKNKFKYIGKDVMLKKIKPKEIFKIIFKILFMGEGKARRNQVEFILV